MKKYSQIIRKIGNTITSKIFIFQKKANVTTTLSPTSYSYN